MKLNAQESRTWRANLSIFESRVRLEIIKILMEVDRLCMSDIARELEKRGFHMNLPAVVKHVQKLEKIEILRGASGSLTDEPDARKTIYTLQGKERVKRIMNQLTNIENLLESGIAFNETAKMLLKVMSRGRRASKEELEQLRSQLIKCESRKIRKHLTEEEKENIELWKTMLAKTS